ncbi:MAG: hypothetical protein JW776_05765 [Candidatus Lokiarchaeota archaeon]|nr:hypothetical protein [Candidatus Lokiarchaeota archaeon]
MTDITETRTEDELVRPSINGDDDQPLRRIPFWNQVKQFFQAIKPIITAHHPTCEAFKEHTFHLFGRDWCIGCYVGYPSGILMLIIGYTTGLFQLIDTSTLWIVGWCLMATYLLSIIGLTKWRWIKIISKIPIGIGAAFLIAAIFSYPLAWWISFSLSFLLIQFFIIIINVKRAIEMRKICNACEYKSDHDNCPGMHSVMKKLRNIKKKE